MEAEERRWAGKLPPVSVPRGDDGSPRDKVRILTESTGDAAAGLEVEARPLGDCMAPGGGVPGTETAGLDPPDEDRMGDCIDEAKEGALALWLKGESEICIPDSDGIALLLTAEVLAPDGEFVLASIRVIDASRAAISEPRESKR